LTQGTETLALYFRKTKVAKQASGINTKPSINKTSHRLLKRSRTKSKENSVDEKVDKQKRDIKKGGGNKRAL